MEVINFLVAFYNQTRPQSALSVLACKQANRLSAFFEFSYIIHREGYSYVTDALQLSYIISQGIRG